MRPAMSSVSARATIDSVRACVPPFCAPSGRPPDAPARISAANAARIALVTTLRCHAIERTALIVGDQHRAVLVHLHVGRTPPPRAVRALPPAHEVLDTRGHPARDAHAHDLRARGLIAIPRPVKGDEQIAAILPVSYTH